MKMYVACNLLIINLSTLFIVHMFMCILNCELCVYSKSCSFRLDLELVTSHAISRQNSIQKIDKYLRKLKLMKEFHVIVLHYLIHLNHENEQCLVLKIVKRLNWKITKPIPSYKVLSFWFGVLSRKISTV